MPISAGYYAYPWNLHAPQDDLQAMRDAGMEHVTVAASYHAGKFLQPRDPRARVYFPEDGTVYFAAREERYGALKPRISRHTRDHDTLRQLCDAGVLPVRGWTVLNHNSRLGWAHPDVVARNAWGDAYPYSLCPANSAVRDYAVALCADLAEAYPLQSLLLESPGWLVYDHGYHHEFAQRPVDGTLAELLALCFCDSCRAGATGHGIDVGGLQGAVRSAADQALKAADGEAVLAGAPLEELTAFRAWRTMIVTSLCRAIRDGVRADVSVRVISTCQRPHATCYLEGADLVELDHTTDGLELPIYQPSARAALDDLRSVIAALGRADRLSVILRPGDPDMASETQLRDTVAGMIAAGITDLSFYNFGLLPATQIGWVERLVAHVREGLIDA